MPENADLLFFEDEQDDIPEAPEVVKEEPAPAPAPKPTQQELDQQRYNAQRQQPQQPAYDPLNDFANDSVGFVQKNARTVAQEEAAVAFARMKYPELRQYETDISAEVQAVVFKAAATGEQISPTEAIERGVERFRKLNPDKASAEPSTSQNSQVYRMSTNMDVNGSGAQRNAPQKTPGAQLSVQQINKMTPAQLEAFDRSLKAERYI